MSVPTREQVEADHEHALEIDERWNAFIAGREDVGALLEADERIELGGTEAVAAEEQLEANPISRSWLITRADAETLLKRPHREPRWRPPYGRAPLLVNRRTRARARGRRDRSRGTSRSGSDPPGEPEPERWLLDLLGRQDKLIDGYVEATDDLIAEVERLRAELDDERGRR